MQTHQLQMIHCPRCGTPRYFADGPVPAMAACVNFGFRWADDEIDGPPTYGCQNVFSTDMVKLVTPHFPPSEQQRWHRPHATHVVEASQLGPFVENGGIVGGAFLK